MQGYLQRLLLENQVISGKEVSKCLCRLRTREGRVWVFMASLDQAAQKKCTKLLKCFIVVYQKEQGSSNKTHTVAGLID